MRWQLVAIFCLVCVGMAIPAAHAVQKVHSSLDLTTDKKVTEIEPNFVLASRSNVVFAHCTHYWVITPEQAAFQKVAFQRISDSYMQAFYDAYLKRVGSPPNSAVTNNYTKYVYAKQAKAMQEINEVISKRFEGCQHGKVIRVLKFIEKLRYDDIAEKERLGQKPAAAPAVPAVSAAPDETTPPVPPVPAATSTITPTTPTSGSH